MGWTYLHTVHGEEPDADPDKWEFVDVAIIGDDGGRRVELAIGKLGQQLCYGWTGARARVRLDAGSARRLAFLILATTS